MFIMFVNVLLYLLVFNTYKLMQLFAITSLTGVFGVRSISVSWDDFFFLAGLRFSMLQPLGARHLKRGVFRGVIFKWRLFSVTTFFNVQSFVWWDWLHTNISWITRGLCHKLISAQWVQKSTELKWQKLFCRRRQRRASTYINNRQIGFAPVFPAFNYVFHPPWHYQRWE